MCQDQGEHMAGPTKINFKIYQGSTFQETLRWESALKVYSPITSISKTAPVVITSSSHGVPAGWRVWVTGVLGMKEINTTEPIIATAVTTDNITVNSINAINYTTYTSGGVVEYNQPVNLSGFTGRMQIRSKLEDTTVIKELTTENGGIVIDNVSKTISLNISATDTAAFSFQTAVYSLELVNGAVVTPFASGNIALIREVTR
jgi:hypothetical protein